MLHTRFNLSGSRRNHLIVDLAQWFDTRRLGYIHYQSGTRHPGMWHGKREETFPLVELGSYCVFKEQRGEFIRTTHDAQRTLHSELDAESTCCERSK